MSDKKCYGLRCQRDADYSYHEMNNSWSWWCAECFDRRFYEKPDWRNHTCGGCGYWCLDKLEGTHGCRKLKINLDTSQEACPDYVPREIES